MLCAWQGGPSLGFCGGRVDDADGSASAELGPSAIQEELYPCPVNGECDAPLGANTVGLIYLNPEGPLGNPVPEDTFPTIRDTFGRMGMNDSETVALIGGGHAFGKAHGACPAGAGPPPNQDPSNPWPGECGTGVGADAFTSGFEGPWTSDPTKWDNVYFQYLADFDQQWEVHKGPGDHFQWRVPGDAGPEAPTADGNGKQKVMMMTSDVSLLYDDDYLGLVKEFGRNLPAFDAAFSEAWYKLTTRDMGPRSRCIGETVPPAKPWQYPLPPPPPPAALPDFGYVRDLLALAMTTPSAALPPDEYDGDLDWGFIFWPCRPPHTVCRAVLSFLVCRVPCAVCRVRRLLIGAVTVL